MLHSVVSIIGGAVVGWCLNLDIYARILIFSLLFWLANNTRVFYYSSSFDVDTNVHFQLLEKAWT